MSKIIVNGKTEVEGRFSVATWRDNSQNPPVLHQDGVFVTEDAPYIEVIDTLQSSRYFIEGIDVYKETAGSEDTNLGYEFTYTSITDITPEPAPPKKKTTTTKKGGTSTRGRRRKSAAADTGNAAGTV